MIRKNDMVQVITGKEKGKTGKVIAILAEEGRALVEKLNRVKKHQRPNPQNPKVGKGGIVEKESPIHLSNLMVYCSKCGKGVRIGIKFDEKGKKIRVCKKCGGPVGQ